jgi:L-lysine 2,3-aminomutase
MLKPIDSHMEKEEEKYDESINANAMENKKMQLQFLENERAIKYAELKQLYEQMKMTTTQGFLSLFSGGNAGMDMLRQQQISDRMSQLECELRRLDFEIDCLRKDIQQ